MNRRKRRILRQLEHEPGVERPAPMMKALAMLVDNLVSNWAYMVRASFAWSLKAREALLVTEHPGEVDRHHAEKRSLLRMEFRTFCAAVFAMPCQIVRGGHRPVYRLLSWDPWQRVFLRLVVRLNGCWLC